MNEKKELKQEELEKVSGGLSERDFAKYYCLITSAKQLSRGYCVGDDIIGPYSSIEEATQAGLDWAVEHSAKGYFNITYQPVLKLPGDNHILESYQKYTYYPSDASI